MKQINYEGRLYTLGEIAKETGLSRSTVDARINRGWDAKRIFTTPADNNLYGFKNVSKNQAELYLDSLTFEALPPMLKNLDFAKHGAKRVTKWGKHIQRFYKSKFDEWFEKEYLPSRNLNESPAS